MPTRIKNPYKRIIFALDYSSPAKAVKVAEELKRYVGMFKIGTELLLAGGLSVIKKIHRQTGKPIFLDLKLYDIPCAVDNAIRIIDKKYPVKYLTYVVRNNPATEVMFSLNSFYDYGINLVGVNKLTSDMISEMSVLSMADKLYHYHKCTNTLICPLNSLHTVKEKYGNYFTLITPGIRFMGEPLQDQRQVGTPYDAIKNGADYIIVGRSVRNAINHIDALKAIAEQVNAASKETDWA